MPTSESNPDQKKFWNERTANLVFISVMLILVMPGAIMLTLKKLHGPGGNTFPPAVRHQIVFMDPTAGRSNEQLRMVPRNFGQWIETVAAKRFNMAGDVELLVKSSGWEPIVSRDRHLQLVAIKNLPGEQTFMLFVWDQNCAPLPENYQIMQTSGSIQSVLKIDAISTELIPVDIRSELQDYGFIKPPSQLLWMVLRGDSAEPARQIDFKFTSERVDVIDELTIPDSTSGTISSDD